MKNNISKIIDSLALAFLAVTFIYFAYDAYRLLKEGSMIESFGDWVSLQQGFYLTALFLGFLSFFTNIRLVLMAPVALIIGYTVESYNLFDEVIHHFFIDKKIYSMMGASHFATNPQYSKLIFFALIILLLSLKVTFKKYRSLNNFFVLILLFINLGSVIIYHKMIPDGTMRFENNYDIETMKKLSILQEKEFKKFCIIMEWHCRLNQSGKIKLINDMAMDDGRKIKYENMAQALTQQAPAQFIETNNFSGIYSVIPVDSALFYEIYSFKRMDDRWKTSVAHFSLGTWLVSFFWFYLTVGLCLLHRKVKIN